MKTKNTIPITVIVPTGNRKDVIEDCLRSVSWADELIVVDSFTNDGTLEIANKYADRILQHEYINSALQKNWAIPQAKNEWVMILDTDERVCEELKKEINQVLADGTDNVGFKIPRVNYVLGEEVRGAGYYPDYQIRLFKRDFAAYDLRHVHSHIVLEGECGVLSSPIIHYTHRSLDQTLKNLLILMTTWEKEERIHRAVQSNKSPTSNIWINMIFRPVAAFGLRYFVEGGWKDGIRGLAVSLIWAMYVCITYMKIWEQELGLAENWWNQHWQKNYQKNS